MKDSFRSEELPHGSHLYHEQQKLIVISPCTVSGKLKNFIFYDIMASVRVVFV